jgi:hypothetical protein
MKKHGYYQYKVEFQKGTFPDGSTWDGWVYEIYDLDSNPELIRESDEWFDSEAEAGFAAVGHISLLENGEG